MMKRSSKRINLSYDSLIKLRSQFIIQSKTRQFSSQFSNLYYQRLNSLKNKLKTSSLLKWKDQFKLVRILDVMIGEKMIIVGTIYCETKLKPNVLEDLSREHHLGSTSSLKKWVSKDDDEVTVMLEDESGRIRLLFDHADDFNFVTGTVMAVLGEETENGDFKVHDIVNAGVPNQSIRPDPKEEEKEGWVAIISGLDLDGTEAIRLDSRCELLVDWLNGQIGSEEEKALAMSVGRLIIAGNSVRASTDPTNPMKKRYGYDPSSYTALPIERLDEVLSELDLPIDLLPGSTDPTTQALPQQPLHQCLLPKSNFEKGNSNLVNGPNPWWAKIGGQTFLGTSGQNLDDVYKYVTHEDRLKLAIQMLEWNHISPTSPDTLWCYPFKDHDPFILNELPKVFFIGNQPKFETELISFPSDDQSSNKKQTRVILVPRFSKTGTIVLVEPFTLECQTITLLKEMVKGINESDDEGDEVLVENEKIEFEMDEDDDDE
ncbi:DNA polymerase alpha/epsilon subunit B-domain-containing protein [Melampsora americana]|nr:DNA polymerase alpha/epsilon subunit B-domain-containing protein [Melampsora americana]